MSLYINGVKQFPETGGGGTYLESNLNLSDVASAATSFTNIKQDATEDATGVIETATDVEAVAQTATDKALVPSNMAVAHPVVANSFKASINVETLSATKTLVVGDSVCQWLDPNGADRVVNLPAEALSTNLMFIILNTANGAGEDLIVKNAAAATIATLGPGMMGMFSCDGTNWKYESDTGLYSDLVRGTSRGVVEQYYGVSWDESADAYVRTGALTGVAVGSSPGDALLPIQAGIRGCILNDSGVVQYYTGATDRTKKAGTTIASVLTGADGQVMQQIPAFYYKYGYSGTSHTWDISFVPLDGFSIHPAFIKNGAFVPYRYIGAYEGSMYDASTGAMVPDADIEVAYTMTSGDKLCSISGQYPKTNETRDEFRLLAAMRGDGWRNQDYDLISAIQLLYLVEYADFDSQDMIGTGRTMFSGGAWEAANQGVGKYIGQCGYSNGDGNVTNATNRASAVSIAAINTDTDVNYHDYMSYRGIENFFGNVWKWVDGINVDTNIVPFVSNDDTDFADDTATNYTPLGVTLPASGWQATLHQQDRGFLPASVGASDSTKITDYVYTASGAWRVVRLGGSAYNALYAGAFYVSVGHASSAIAVDFGGRLTY